MKPRYVDRPENDTPFLRVVRLMFIIIVTFMVHQWALHHPYIRDFDRYIYVCCGAMAAIIIVIIESQIRHAYPQELLIGLFGLVCGLSTSVLIQYVIPENQPHYNTDMTRFSLHLFLGYFGITIGLRNAHRLNFKSLLAHTEDRLYGAKILDTSVLIDGRITEISEAGFLEGLIVIPSFVVNELQTLSDSEDYFKRSKGRRGLDISKRLQNSVGCEVEILEEDFPNLAGVDKKLLALSKKYEGTLITMDFNLSKVAQIEGIQVMNINQLAQSLKTAVLPGEEIQIHIIREGKEANQGVGYLDDGTMVVVENGRKYMGKTVDVSAASVLQTSAGRMIFAKPIEDMPQSKTA
ncbi:MAG: PIN domain-containing protein [Candidatus Omnitrophota bacterium]